MANAIKKTSNRTAYAVVCTNRSALKLDDQTPNFVFVDGKIKDFKVPSSPELERYKEITGKVGPEESVNAAESVQYVPTVQTICMDETVAKYACLNLMIEHQGTGATFHVEEVRLDNTSRLFGMCESLKNLLGKVEVKKLIPTSYDSPNEEGISGKIDLD